jgi:hypothetical protein
MRRPLPADMERMDLNWIREGREMPNPVEPDRDINAILKLLRDHRDDEATAAAIDKVETEWRAFQKVWNGRWDQEPKDWKDSDARGAQRNDAGHVSVHLRSVLLRLKDQQGGIQLPLSYAWLAAKDLAEREKRLADLRSGASGVPDDGGPVP